MNAYIKTLVDGSGSQILPRTRAKAVMAESGVTAEAKFAEIAGELRGISSTIAKARPNIIGTYPVAGGQAVTAGDVVDVQADGSVGKTITPVANVETAIGGSVNHLKAIRLNDHQSIAVSCVGNTNNLYSASLKLLGYRSNAVSTEDAATLRTADYGVTGYAAAARLSDTKFVAGYVGANVLYAQVGTVSGTAITLGSQFQLSAATTTYNALIPLSEAAFLSVYNRSGLKAKVFPVSGTTITTTAGEVSLPGNTSAAYISAPPPG